MRSDPARFEDVPTFRETFLLHFTQPGDAQALRRIGRILFLMVNEHRQYWPEPAVKSPRRELRAVLADLRHLEGYLRLHLGDFPIGPELAQEVREVGHRLEDALHTVKRFES
ncbi:MAG TPA: hypothetical protein VN493_11685 [Thermoanaerobaculia bacterium]|nr:hypothetical protein [Thermoanaerobaculia bacterium]